MVKLGGWLAGWLDSEIQILGSGIQCRNLSVSLPAPLPLPANHCRVFPAIENHFCSSPALELVTGSRVALFLVLRDWNLVNPVISDMDLRHGSISADECEFSPPGLFVSVVVLLLFVSAKAMRPLSVVIIWELRNKRSEGFLSLQRCCDMTFDTTIR